MYGPELTYCISYKNETSTKEPHEISEDIARTAVGSVIRYTGISLLLQVAKKFCINMLLIGFVVKLNCFDFFNRDEFPVSNL